MKKKSYLTLLGVAFLAAAAWASTVVYSKNVVNDPVLAYSNTYTVDLKTAGRNGQSIDTFSAQTVYSSATVPSTSFTDGGLGTGTVTVGSNSGLAAVAASQTITVASTSSLKNAILVVNGKQLRQGYDWRIGADVNTTATNIAAIVNKVAGIQASASSAVVSATATVAGTAGNSITLAKISAGNLTLGGATFTGGVDPGYVQVGSNQVRQGTNWAVAGSATLTAANIATALRANSTINGLVTVSTSGAVITLTAKAVGTAGNLALATFPSAITKSGALMTGGSDSAWTLNTTNIHKVSHGLGTGLPVLYTTGTVAISGLTNATTYYAIKVDADNFKLASSQVNAIAGTAIVLASTSTAGPHTYTLAPLAIGGTFSFKWQYSNDGTNWLDLSVSSVTFGTPYTASSTSWDFGTVAYRYLRVNEVAGTAGAWNLLISGYGKNNN